MVADPAQRKETMAPYQVLPVPDQLTEPFWEAAKRGRLAIQQCQNCQRLHHPPVHYCMSCHDPEPEFAFAELSGRGTVYSHYIHYDSDIAAFKEHVPYPVVTVELDEQPGLMLVTNILGCDYDAIRAGMAVEVVFEEASEEISMPQFRPRSDAGSSEGA